MFIILVLVFFLLSVLWAFLTIKHHEQSLQDFIPRKKRQYYIAIIGVACVSIGPIIIISSYISALIDSLMYDQAAIGYVVLFLTAPAFLAVVIKFGLMSLYLKTLRPTSYTLQKRKAKNRRLVIGILALASLFIYIPVIKFYLLLTLSQTSNMFDFIIKLEASQFHPVKLIYSFFFIGPILMIIAAIMDLIDEQDREERD